MKTILVCLSFLMIRCTVEPTQRQIDEAAETQIAEAGRCTKVAQLLKLTGENMVNDQGSRYCFIPRFTLDGPPGISIGDAEMRAVLRFERIRESVKSRSIRE